MSSHLKQSLSLTLAFLLALGLCFVTGLPSQAQFPMPEGLSAERLNDPPPEVTRYGNIEAIAVNSPLSNFTLFTIASPTVYDRNSEAVGDQIPVERRAEEIRDKLLLLIKRPMDPETLVFEVSMLRNIPVIDVRDERYTRPLILVSVTQYDADYNGLPVDELANKWRDRLEKDLRSRLERLPEDKQRVFQIISGLIFLTMVLFGLKYRVSKRQKQLRRRKQAISVETANSASAREALPGTSQVSIYEQVEQKKTSLFRKLQQTFTLNRRLAVLDFIQWLLFWLFVLAWYAGFVWVSIASPYLLLNSPLGGPLKVVVGLLSTWFFTGLAIRTCRRLIDYFATDREGMDLGDFILFGDAQRRQLRTITIAGAAKSLVTVLIALIGILQALQALNISTVSLVAITSVAGLAITFGSQNLVKDLVNGFFILAEDQYAIGDVIDLNGTAGLVEHLNLRVTQLRSSEGELVTIPNSGISQVKNLTRSWSRVSFSIEVAYHTNPDKALELLNEVSQTFYNDPEWRDKMRAEPAVLGIDSVSHSGLTITTWIQTEPAQQWAVGREFRLRVRRALGEHGIDIGTPRQTYVYEPMWNNAISFSEEMAEQEG